MFTIEYENGTVQHKKLVSLEDYNRYQYHLNAIRNSEDLELKEKAELMDGVRKAFDKKHGNYFVTDSPLYHAWYKDTGLLEVNGYQFRINIY